MCVGWQDGALGVPGKADKKGRNVVTETLNTNLQFLVPSLAEHRWSSTPPTQHLVRIYRVSLFIFSHLVFDVFNPLKCILERK